MNALQVMDRYWKEVIQVSTQKHDINVQYLYDNLITTHFFVAGPLVLYMEGRVRALPDEVL